MSQSKLRPVCSFPEATHWFTVISNSSNSFRSFWTPSRTIHSFWTKKWSANVAGISAFSPLESIYFSRGKKSQQSKNDGNVVSPEMHQLRDFGNFWRKSQILGFSKCREFGENFSPFVRRRSFHWGLSCCRLQGRLGRFPRDVLPPFSTGEVWSRAGLGEMFRFRIFSGPYTLPETNSKRTWK